jgi:phosphoglycerate dehydrogenase-like enzyme
MKIIVVNKKSEFSEDQIKKLDNTGDLVFIESSEDFKTTKEFFTSEEKVIALDPGISEWAFPNDIVDKIPNLKGVCLPTTKHEWVDGKYLKRNGIILTNVPKYSTESVAEHCILLMLSLSKKLPMIINEGWKLNYDKHLGNEVKGANMGVIGLGDIGKRVSELGEAMGMSVSYWSRKSKDPRFDYMELDELIKNSDYIFLTISESPETKNFFSKNKADLMKKGSCVINVSGDDVWDFEYLSEKVKTGQIFGIALDDDRRQMSDSKTNILITPHIAWYTKEAFKEDFRIWVECVCSVVLGNPINVVNP